jgi:hypothetical protein
VAIYQHHINVALTDFATVTAKQGGAFIGNRIAPELSVAKLTDAYYVYDTAHLRTSDESAYKGGAQVNRVSWTESEDSYKIRAYALEVGIPTEQIKNADPLVDPERRRTKFLVGRMRLAAEKRVADAFFNGSNFTNTSAIAAADRWNASTSDPFGLVQTAVAAVRSRIGQNARTLVMGDTVWKALVQHPDVIGRLQPTVRGGVATKEMLASMFDVDEILVGSAIYDAAVEGAATSVTDIWGKYLAVCYMEQANNTDDGVITPMREFVWNQEPRFGVSTYDEPETRSRVVQCVEYSALKVISVGAVQLYSTVVD